MRALLQRVERASVEVDGQPIAAIGPGLLVLLGVAGEDDDRTVDQLAARVAALRIFRDAEGRTNRSVVEVGGSALVVSQFTLYADTSRGRRPGSPTRARRRSPNGSVGASRTGSGRPESPRSGWDGSARRCASSSSTMARSRSGSIPLIGPRVNRRRVPPTTRRGPGGAPPSRRGRALVVDLSAEAVRLAGRGGL
jgi:D-tyrosyl-tRNA(Tyr) deacylase